MNKIGYITALTDIELLEFPKNIYRKLKNAGISILADICIQPSYELGRILDYDPLDYDFVKQRVEIQGYKLEWDYTSWDKLKSHSIYSPKANKNKNKNKSEKEENKDV